ncbi:MAG TPA: glycosyltransferase [Candidatus Methanoperedens sp.]|nr:glycosyltransferase [Candidatus Methanoperedens sp.]
MARAGDGVAGKTVRILHVVPSLQRRGAERFAVRLAAHLGRAGHETRLVCLFPSADDAGAGQLGDWACCPRGATPLGVVAWLRREYRRYRPDIVLAHGGVPHRYAVLARGCAARPALVYRKIGLTAPWLRFPRALRLPLHRWLLRRAERICCVAEVVRREVTDLLRVPAARTAVIYEGVAEERYRSSPPRERARAALDIAAVRPVLLGVGALGWEKHQEAMLRALASIRREVPQALLLLAGDGPERGRLERVAVETGAVDAVRFLGVRHDVPALLAAADVLLLTSLTEGLPGVLIEAGLAGLPAVAWDVAGVREVVQDGVTGLVPPFGDEQAVASDVLRLLGDGEAARRMGAAARAFCSERFDLQRCVDAHLRLFQDVLGAGG